MTIRMFAGKGGVGKSTCAAAYALYSAESGPHLIVDYDQQHSVRSVLDLQGELPPNDVLKTGIPNLYLGTVELLKYISVTEAKERGMSIEEYFDQFPADYGLLPFHDMTHRFFGLLTATDVISYFATLTQLFEKAVHNGIGNITIDIEPTSGLSRLLTSADSLCRSLENLKKLPGLSKFILGRTWPDVRAYVDGAFIAKADEYGPRMVETAEMIKGADYYLVCNPARGPVEQMFEVGDIVEKFGGKVKGLVINNERGEKHEAEQITRVRRMSEYSPVIEIDHDPVICESSDKKRLYRALREIGSKFDSE